MTVSKQSQDGTPWSTWHIYNSYVSLSVCILTNTFFKLILRYPVVVLGNYPSSISFLGVV